MKKTICEVFKDFTNHGKETNRAITLSSGPLNISKCRDHRQDLPVIWKARFLQRHVESSASMYESSSSHFFRPTTGIQLGPDVFNESRLVMTMFTDFGVKEVFCSFI